MKQKELNQLSNIVESLVPVEHEFILITYKDKNNGRAELTYSSTLEDDETCFILNEAIKKLNRRKQNENK